VTHPNNLPNVSPARSTTRVQTNRTSKRGITLTLWASHTAPARGANPAPHRDALRLDPYRELFRGAARGSIIATRVTARLSSMSISPDFRRRSNSWRLMPIMPRYSRAFSSTSWSHRSGLSSRIWLSVRHPSEVFVTRNWPRGPDPWLSPEPPQATGALHEHRQSVPVRRPTEGSAAQTSPFGPALVHHTRRCDCFAT
jgi:hypothetical protein